jgi:hypothetical protein
MVKEANVVLLQRNHPAGPVELDDLDPARMRPLQTRAVL